jgi:quercetin dioxygenase-like cupin family protein
MRKPFGSALWLVLFMPILGCGNGDVDDAGVVHDIVAASDQAEMLLENDYVTAARFELESGDRLPTHECAHHVIYSLSSYEMEYSINGKRQREEFKRGKAYWREAGVQSIKNVGKTDAEYIVITRKTSTLPEFDPADIDNDITEMTPDNSVVLLENQCIKVVEVILNPGQRLPGHGGLNRIVYSLSSYETSYKEIVKDTMEAREVSFDEKDIRWYDANRYAIANTGDSPAHFIVFTFIE